MLSCICVNRKEIKSNYSVSDQMNFEDSLESSQILAIFDLFTDFLEICTVAIRKIEEETNFVCETF